MASVWGDDRAPLFAKLRTMEGGEESSSGPVPGTVATESILSLMPYPVVWGITIP